jgi:hypothetical protein
LSGRQAGLPHLAGAFHRLPDAGGGLRVEEVSHRQGRGEDALLHVLSWRIRDPRLLRGARPSREPRLRADLRGGAAWLYHNFIEVGETQVWIDQPVDTPAETDDLPLPVDGGCE